MTVAEFNASRFSRPAVSPGLIIAIMLLLVLVVLGAGIGSSFMPPQRVFAAVLGQGSRPDELILWKLRLPRVCLAVTGGAALALAGAILQRVVRNPLASPSILGITDGAAVGVVTFLWLYSNETNALVVSIHWLPVAAVLGAAIFTIVTGALTLADPRRGPLGLILYGIAIAALAKALVTLLMIMGPVYLAGQAMTWLAGTVGAAHWSDVAVLSVILGLSMPLIALSARVLGQLRLDPDSARSTGLSLGMSQIAMVGLAVLLTAAAVAFVGAIGFVGLIAPHAARRLVGEGGASWLPVSALVGSSLVLAADILARVIAPPIEVPAGAVTAVIGAPLFIMLLIRGRTLHG